MKNKKMKYINYSILAIGSCLLLTGCISKHETNRWQYLQHCMNIYISEGYDDISRPKSLILKSNDCMVFKQGIYEMGAINTVPTDNTIIHISGVWTVVGDTMTLYPKAKIETHDLNYHIKTMDYAVPDYNNATRKFLIIGDTLKDITQYSRMDSADLAEYGTCLLYTSPSPRDA